MPIYKPQALQGVSMAGNTANAGTLVSAGTVYLSGGNNITLSQNGSSVMISGGGIGGVSMAGNTANAGTLISAGTVYFSGGNNITLSQNGSSIMFSGPATLDRSWMHINEGSMTTVWNVSASSRRPIFVPFWNDANALHVKTFRFYASRMSGTTLQMTAHLGFYTMVNSSQISLLSSTSQSYSLSTSAMYSGVQAYEITGLSALVIPQGRIVFALHLDATTADKAALNYFGRFQGPTGLAGTVFGTTNSATQNTNQIVRMQGVYSTTTSALPGSVAMTQITGGGSTVADIYALIQDF